MYYAGKFGVRPSHVARVRAGRAQCGGAFSFQRAGAFIQCAAKARYLKLRRQAVYLRAPCFLLLIFISFFVPNLATYKGNRASRRMRERTNTYPPTPPPREPSFRFRDTRDGDAAESWPLFVD